MAYENLFRLLIIPMVDCSSTNVLVRLILVMVCSFSGLGLISSRGHIAPKDIKFREQLSKGPLELQHFQIKCDTILAITIKNFQNVLIVFKFAFNRSKCNMSNTCATFDIPVNLFHFLLKHIVTNSETKGKMCEPIFFPQGILKGA